MSAGSSPKKYVKVWFLLLVLFAISVIGPAFEIRWLTLITAFGIAGVKAFVVAKEFMHLNVEKKIVSYMLGSMFLACVLFYFGVAGDVMNSKGQHWEKKVYKVEKTKASH
ncbi:MAG: caa(3)-type oxidase subunit IV [Bdellovibrionaceae bacterium]|jgi:caa(3)-type oxidase subunit IV|nr:caa(3)-type oxidase subunit IV [Pseudobdellovibrionaceae bacterium]